METQYASILGTAIEAWDEQHVFVQDRQIETADAEPVRDFHVVCFVPQHLAVGVGGTARSLDDVMALGLVIRQRRVGIPFAVMPLSQQVFGGHTLHTCAACGQHAVHHHHFVKVGRAREQLVKRETVCGKVMTLDMLFVVVDGFPDTQAPDRVEGTGTQQRQVGSLCVGNL